MRSLSAAEEDTATRPRSRFSEWQQRKAGGMLSLSHLVGAAEEDRRATAHARGGGEEDGREEGGRGPAGGGRLSSPNPRTYIGSGKVAEIRSAVQALDIETIIFDDELSAGQLRNLEKSFGGGVRVCDRTALILDIFNQRAATHEAALQVTLAQMEYQLPRLTKLWTHLERQSGGQVKGMGEKQIEVDKRILRTQISTLRKELESVRKHRKLYRNRRRSVPIPVVSLVGYTNAGKSTLLNRLTGADVLAEDKLFATLDPTTRRVLMKSGTEFLLTDTVGFIQKLPTMLVAAFRATLEEISESSIIVHLADISHPLAQQQIGAVDKVLKELDIDSVPKLVVWNKIRIMFDALVLSILAPRSIIKPAQ
ncbi:GTP-binding protein hflX [Triticum urartu]|uniref:GTP-binding protein hflX n=1 Tax=Triticum urartu TaxID=4572 RepID=M7YFH2_TRIUA|nr:GTP-binding protein hflX [Triticum urartu]